MSLKPGFHLNHAISLCRKSGAGGLPANYPEPGHEGILTAEIIIFMALPQVISKFLKQRKRKCCSNISFEHSQTKQSQHIRSLYTLQVVEKARHAVLVCEASGSPKPTITWIKDTMPIDLKANPRLSLMKQGKLRGKAAVTIRKILHQDSPQYPVQLS